VLASGPHMVASGPHKLRFLTLAQTSSYATVFRRYTDNIEDRQTLRQRVQYYWIHSFSCRSFSYWNKYGHL